MSRDRSILIQRIQCPIEGQPELCLDIEVEHEKSRYIGYTGQKSQPGYYLHGRLMEHMESGGIKFQICGSLRDYDEFLAPGDRYNANTLKKLAASINGGKLAEFIGKVQAKNPTLPLASSSPLHTCDPAFIAEIKEIATASGKFTPEQVYVYWVEYVRECDSRDQGPVLFEFREWNKNKFAPAEVA